MPIPAQFAHIRQRDATTRLLTGVADVPTRKTTAIYRYCERDERPDLGCRHLSERAAFPHTYSHYRHFGACFISIHTFLSGTFTPCLFTEHPPYPVVCNTKDTPTHPTFTVYAL